MVQGINPKTPSFKATTVDLNKAFQPLPMEIVAANQSYSSAPPMAAAGLGPEKPKKKHGFLKTVAALAVVVGGTITGAYFFKNRRIKGSIDKLNDIAKKVFGEGKVPEEISKSKEIKEIVGKLETPVSSAAEEIKQDFGKIKESTDSPKFLDKALDTLSKPADWIKNKYAEIKAKK